jgi:hypothetical protein
VIAAVRPGVVFAVLLGVALPAQLVSATANPSMPSVVQHSCARVVQTGESLSAIVDEIDEDGVTVAALQAENEIRDADHIEAEMMLDVCVGNGRDDVSGQTRVITAAVGTGVEAQQRRLNELFSPFGTPELLVDGWSGPLTANSSARRGSYSGCRSCSVTCNPAAQKSSP